MRDPEMIFEAEESGDETNLAPFYWRNDYAESSSILPSWRKDEHT